MIKSFYTGNKKELFLLYINLMIINFNIFRFGDGDGTRQWIFDWFEYYYCGNNRTV